jgi:hypothetical protein
MKLLGYVIVIFFLLIILASFLVASLYILVAIFNTYFGFSLVLATAYFILLVLHYWASIYFQAKLWLQKRKDGNVNL